MSIMSIQQSTSARKSSNFISQNPVLRYMANGWQLIPAQGYHSILHTPSLAKEHGNHKNDINLWQRPWENLYINHWQPHHLSASGASDATRPSPGNIKHVAAELKWIKTIWAKWARSMNVTIWQHDVSWCFTAFQRFHCMISVRPLPRQPLPHLAQNFF